MEQALLDRAKKAMDKAKINMMSNPNSVFICTVCFSMKIVWDVSLPTAATDGRSIFVNPVSYLALTEGQQLSRLAHETWHPALQHLGRVGTRDKMKWNAACDYYINLMLTDAGFEKIDTWLWDEQYRGMSADQIYDLLPDPPGGWPQEIDDLREPKDEIERQDLQQHIDRVLIRAVMQSQMGGDKPGTVPEDITLYLDQLLNPKLPWHRILYKFMNSLAKTDYSWSKPNRRFFPDHYLPGLLGASMMDFAAAVDISGSVRDYQFKQMVSDLHYVVKQFKPKLLRLLQFDTQIKEISRIRDTTELRKVHFHGRGGTNVAPVMEWALKEKPSLLLIFTDGGLSHNYIDPGMPVIWLIHNNPYFDPPFGKVIHYTL